MAKAKAAPHGNRQYTTVSGGASAGGREATIQVPACAPPPVAPRRLKVHELIDRLPGMPKSMAVGCFLAPRAADGMDELDRADHDAVKQLVANSERLLKDCPANRWGFELAKAIGALVQESAIRCGKSYVDLAGLRPAQLMQIIASMPPSPVDRPIFHDGYLLTFGGRSWRLDESEAGVLKALIKLKAANKSELVEQSEIGDAPRVLRRMLTKYPCLRGHVHMPGGKGKGGYTTDLE